MADPNRTDDHVPEPFVTADHTPTEAPANGTDTPSPPGEAFAAHGEELSPGEPGDTLPELAGYTLAGEIARGGMGVVYAARDAAFGRRVAVKTLLPKFAGRSDLAAQFDREADITAGLPHPGVPPVHARGTLVDGRPFIAMKLIGGRTLADELAEPDHVSRWPRLLGVFEQICQTVGFAHARGIIHRDLKPLNVMVGEFGEVQVMDWGLARTPANRDREETGDDIGVATNSGGCETVAGSAKGTPAFMPPEQARGEWDRVDARADVFALGGILAVILTGRPPFTGPNGREVLKRAAAADLGNAFARLAACGADADLIALCQWCLSADPTDRPADGKAVAGAVAAYRAGVEERARKAEADRAVAKAEAREQRKRRKVQLALGAAVLLLAAGGGAFAWWQDRQASQRNAEALRRQIADERVASITRERETRNRDAVVAALGRCEQALRESDAETAAPALAEVVKRLPEGGAEGFAARVERCRVDLTILQELGRIDDFRWTPVENKFPDRVGITARWQQVFAGFGVVPGTTTAAEAKRRLDESLIRDRLVGALDLWLLAGGPPELVAILSAADPDSYRDAMRWAVGLGQVWWVQMLAAHPLALEQPGRFAIALGVNKSISVERRRAMLEQAVAGRPGDLEILMPLAWTYPINRSVGAVERLRWAQAAVSAHPRNALAHNNLGVALDDKGEVDSAIAEYQQAITLDPKHALAHYNLGNALRGKLQFDAAIAEYRQAIALDPKLAIAHYNLGHALHDKGQVDAAIAEYRQAIALDPKDAKAHFNLGTTLHNKGELDAAIIEYQQAIALDPRHAKAHNNLGNALRGKLQFDAAIAEYRKAIALDPKLAPAHNNLGGALAVKLQFDAAIAEHKQAIALDPKFAAAHVSLGTVYFVQKKYPEAIACARAAIQADPKFPNAHVLLGFALQQTGDIRGAQAALTEAARLDRRWASRLKQLPPLEVAPPPRKVKPKGP